MSFLYLLGLVVSIFGMVVLDRRFGLFFWRDARRAAVVLPVGVILFLVWDLFGIGLPMCLISAELVVKRLRGDTSAGPMSEPLRPGIPAS